MDASTTATGMRIHGEPTDDQVMDSVAKAVRDAATTAGQHATAVKNAVTPSGLVRSVSRISYTGAYAIAFGVVYTVVFVAQLLPRDNPVMDGFSDGAQAAVDALEHGGPG